MPETVALPLYATESEVLFWLMCRFSSLYTCLNSVDCVGWHVAPRVGLDLAPLLGLRGPLKGRRLAQLLVVRLAPLLGRRGLRLPLAILPSPESQSMEGERKVYQPVSNSVLAIENLSDNGCDPETLW